ncbi:MAG: M24B family metallopeptidase, partial [Spirochaetia bacterium]|nr:M24B family metallopeptidase [Spirochaetia bacterium]
IFHLSSITHEMRLIKDAQEIALMKECAEITREAHVEAMKMVRPGIYEYELDAKIMQTFKKYGGDFAYPSIVASGNNACILHYIENNAVIKENDLILIDAGAEKDYLNADVTRTFPASGTFTQAQKTIYEIVLAAQKKAISSMIENNNLENVHLDAVRILTEGLIETGILTGSVDENLEKQTYKKFYMHKTSHWLGRDVHDVGNYHLGKEFRPLQNGMVATIEPGIYIEKDLPDIPDEFRGIGIRIEDDVLVKGNQPEVLTESIPKEISEIENLILKNQSSE